MASRPNRIAMSKQPRPAVWLPAYRARSGADTFTEQLANGLIERGFRAEISWIPNRCEFAPWSVTKPQLPRWANIVHVNSWLNQRFVPGNIPVVATVHLCVHDPELRPYNSALQSMYHRFWIMPREQRLLQNVSRIVGVSEYTARQTKTCLNLNSVGTIHNGVDTTRFKPIVRSHPNAPFRLLYVGNWAQRKGVDLLPEIMKALGPDFELLFTESRSRTQSSTNMPANMHSVGRINDKDVLIKTYQQADALLFPTRLEGLPLCALEAQSCGLPVIATNGSSLPETVENGLTGILCEQDDIEAFANAARTLANDEVRWHRMREAARQRVEDRFTLDAMIDDYIALYRSALSSLTTSARQDSGSVQPSSSKSCNKLRIGKQP